MSSTQHPVRRFTRRAAAMFAACVAVAAGLVTYGLSAAGATTTAPAAKTFTFALKASPGIASCLPHARGQPQDERQQRIPVRPVQRRDDRVVIDTHASPPGRAGPPSWAHSQLNHDERVLRYNAEESRGRRKRFAAFRRPGGAVTGARGTAVPR